MTVGHTDVKQKMSVGVTAGSKLSTYPVSTKIDMIRKSIMTKQKKTLSVSIKLN